IFIAKCRMIGLKVEPKEVGKKIHYELSGNKDTIKLVSSQIKDPKNDKHKANIDGPHDKSGKSVLTFKDVNLLKSILKAKGNKLDSMFAAQSTYDPNKISKFPSGSSSEPSKPIDLAVKARDNWQAELGALFKTDGVQISWDEKNKYWVIDLSSLKLSQSAL